ncbi:MAG: hypothetical protein LBG80_06075 [Bacteroidales bacterium]|jgi:hypothetical protein|nr:hypothetical protein [Bacteroidales bacterium]
MVKKFLQPLVVVGMCVMMTGCFGGAGIDTKIDPKIMENKEEVQKLYDAILDRMGDQATKAHEITITVSNPEDKGNKGDAYLMILADMQNPSNSKKLQRCMFHGEIGGWQSAQEVTVDVRGSDKEKADFRLEDELFDFKNQINAEKLHKIILDAYEKDNKEPEKYTYRYVYSVGISITGITVDVKGKLAANDQIIDDRYYFDLDGNPLHD